MTMRVCKIITTIKHPDLHPTGTKDHLSVWDAKYYDLCVDYALRAVRIQRLDAGKPKGRIHEIPFEGVVRVELEAPQEAPQAPIPIRGTKGGVA